jgi:hypothetical protein
MPSKQIPLRPNNGIHRENQVKPRRFLILSLGLNLALAAIFFTLWRNRSAPMVVPFTPASKFGALAVMKNMSPAAAGEPAANSAFHWGMIESKDYRQFVANLRAVGCPERTIRDIIVAEIDEFNATKDSPAPSIPPPWENADHRRAKSLAWAAKLSARQAEKRALVKELIGYEWDNRANEVWHEDYMTGVLLGFLPDTKAPQLLAIVGKYTDQANSVKEAANGILIDEDRARLRTLYDGLVTEVSQLLTPVERDELELRVQAGTFLSGRDDIRWDGVPVTGAELREFVRLSKSYKDTFQDQFLGFDNLSEAGVALKRAAFAKQVETLLGPARFADYQRAQDYSFDEMFEFTQARNLPKAAAIKIYNVSQAAEDQASQVKEDKSLSPGEQTVALAVLKTTVAGTVSSVLGNAYRDYLNGPGQWLETLVPPPEPTAQNKGP